MNSEAEMDTGTEKLSSTEDGSGNPSNRDDTENPNGKVDDENREITVIDLPLELLVKIIDMVPISQWASLELVNHQFHELVHDFWGRLLEIRLDELVYNEVKKKENLYQVVEPISEKFLIRAPNVTSISGFAEFFDENKPIRLETIRLLSKFKHLQTIDFSGKDIISAEIFAVFLESSASRQCWKSLNIVDGIFWNMEIQNAIDKKNQPALNLDCFKFNMETLRIFDRFLSIQWSGINKLIIVDSVDSAKEVLSIIRQCTQVAHLEVKIPKCGIGNGQSSFGDFMRGVSDLVNLSSLKILGQSPWNNAFHDALLGLIHDLGLRPITDLALVDFWCTEQMLDAIIHYLPRLKSLEINVTDGMTPCLERLANGMGELEKFRCCGSQVDGTVVRAIGANMSKLRWIHLKYPGCKPEDFTILGDLGNLKELRITGNGLKSETVKTWTRLGFGSCLEALEFEIYGRISPEEMANFLKNMPRLRSLKLSGVTDGILKAIAKSCPKLVELDIDWSSITSTGIQSFIDRCSELKYLKVARHNDWFPSALKVGKCRKITFNFDDDERRYVERFWFWRASVFEVL